MSTFLYWIPTNKPTVDRETVERFGLAYALPGSVIARQCYQGPAGGVVGAVLIAGEAAGKANHGYFATEQTWERIDGSEAWVGWETKNPPTPEGLERVRMTPLRKSVELCDGNQWQCPIAQRPIETESDVPFPVCVLPQSAVRKDGRWQVGEVKKQYRQLWAIANQVFDDVLHGGKNGDGRIEAQLDFAVEALAANYRIGPTEAGILQLFETDGNVAWDVLRVLIDYEQWKEILSGKSEAAA